MVLAPNMFISDIAFEFAKSGGISININADNCKIQNCSFNTSGTGIYSNKDHTQIYNSTFDEIDYIEIVDTEPLSPLKIIKERALLALSVFFGKTRLIDNTILKIKRKNKQ